MKTASTQFRVLIAVSLILGMLGAVRWLGLPVGAPSLSFAQAANDDADERKRRESHEVDKHAIMAQILKSQDNLKKIEQALERLGDGQDPKRNETRSALLAERFELRKHIHNLERELHGPRGEEQRRLRHRLEDLESEIEKLVDQGKIEQAEALKREAHKLTRELERRESHGEPHHNLERRLHHLRVAIENLKEAGFHEHAERLADEAEELERELHEHRRGHDHGDHEHGHVEELQSAIHNLHRQMEQMKREMNEIKQGLKKLSAQLRSAR